MTENLSERPAPAATGRLHKTPILHLLVYSLDKKLSGTLELRAPAEEEGGLGEAVAILFIEGQPGKIRTSAPVAYLGRVLLELGFIDQPTLDRSLMEISRTKRLHGQTLLASRSIDRPKLEKALAEQLVQKLKHTFSLPPETEYAYYDGFDSLHRFGGDEIVFIDPLPIIWAAVREAPPWEHMHAALTRVGNLALRLSSKAELHRFGFNEKETALLTNLRARPMRLSELIATEMLRPRETQLLVYCLIITKQLQVVQESASMPPPKLASNPPDQPGGDCTTAPGGFSFSLRAAMSTSPTGFSSGPSSPPPRGLTDAPPKSVPPKSVPPRSSPPESVPAPSVRSKPMPLERTPPPMAAPVGALTPELLKRREEILERAAGIDREDYFIMLDLDRSAGVEEVRTKFFQLAKVWHPDRLPPALADLRDPCSRVFARLSEAHQTLTEENRRLRYMDLLKGGGATPEAQATIALVVTAAQDFQKAEICLKRSDFVQAETLCRKANEADPEQPEYIALLAWLEAMKQENQSPAATERLIARLDQAISLSNKCERAFFYRGMLYKKLENIPRAVRDFRKASDLNPRNIDALREVRLYEMRAQKGGSSPPTATGKHSAVKAEPPKGGLFGKLFKK